jgi:hypothetical protein
MSFFFTKLLVVARSVRGFPYAGLQLEVGCDVVVWLGRTSALVDWLIVVGGGVILNLNLVSRVSRGYSLP